MYLSPSTAKFNFNCLVEVASNMHKQDIKNKFNNDDDDLHSNLNMEITSFDFMSIRPTNFDFGRDLIYQIGAKLISIKISRDDIENYQDLAMIEFILRHCPNLKHIIIQDIQLTNEILMNCMPTLRQLQTIEFIECGIYETHIDLILQSSSQTLEQLNIKYTCNMICKCVLSLIDDDENTMSMGDWSVIKKHEESPYPSNLEIYHHQIINDRGALSEIFTALKLQSKIKHQHYLEIKQIAPSKY